MINEESISNETTANELIHQQEFGLQLKQAREQRGLTISEIAEHLHLREEILKALEASNLEQLPAPTFTQGYIRAYARLLKLPEDTILDAYNMSIPCKEKPLVPNYGMPMQPKENTAVVQPLIIILVVVLFMLAAYLLVTFEEEVTELDTSGQITRDSNEAELEAFTGVTGDESDPPGQAHETETGDIIQQGAEEILQPEQGAAEVDQPETVTEPEEAVKTEQVTPQLFDKQSSVQPETEPEGRAYIEADELSQVKVTPIAPGDDVLNLQTDSASWAEVQDANGHRLIFELLKKGQLYRLKGTAPFRVFLGNAPSTKVRVNDKEVEFSSFVRSNNIASILVSHKAMVINSQRDKISFNSNDEKVQKNSSDFED